MRRRELISTYPQLLGLAHAKHVLLVVGGGAGPPGGAAFHVADDARGVFVRRPLAVRWSGWECHRVDARATEPAELHRGSLLFVRMATAIHPPKTFLRETELWRSGPA